jgi:hypothetical protein
MTTAALVRSEGTGWETDIRCHSSVHWMDGSSVPRIPVSPLHPTPTVSLSPAQVVSLAGLRRGVRGNPRAGG